MVINRIIDNAAVAAASLTAARSPPRGHRRWPTPCTQGRDGLRCRPAHACSPEWAAWANGVAVRELDFHDTFLAAEYSPPGRQHPAPARRRPAPRLRRRRPGPRHRDRLRGPGRSRPGHLPARAQDRPRRAPRPVGAAGIGNLSPAHRDDLPGHRPGAAHRRPPPASPARARSPAGRPMRRRSPASRHRGRRPRHARRGRARPDLRGRGRCHRLAARGSRTRTTTFRCPPPGSPSGPSSTPTPRSTRRSTRARR